jgi:hypothetical protein
LLDDPEKSRVLRQYQANISEGKYPDLYLRCFAQVSAAQMRVVRFDPYDSFGFLQIHTLIQSGHLAMFAVHVGQTPYADQEIELNDMALSTLVSPFVAHFYGQFRHGDGFLRNEKPILAIIKLANRNNAFVIIPPLDIPLEVGAMEMGQVLYWLSGAWGVSGGALNGLARWPYGSQWIFVFTPTFVCQNEPRFEALESELVGDFQSFINPYDVWKNEG